MHVLHIVWEVFVLTINRICVLHTNLVGSTIILIRPEEDNRSSTKPRKMFLKYFV